MDIEQIRTFCLSLPFATEDIKWEDDLCFSIGNKLFCTGGLNPPHHFSFKVKSQHFFKFLYLKMSNLYTEPGPLFPSE